MGLPFKDINCLGISAPNLSPVPAANIIAPIFFNRITPNKKGSAGLLNKYFYENPAEFLYELYHVLI